jgi:hypothetical protein
MPDRSGRGRQPTSGKQRTNRERGLGWEHAQNRERLLRRHVDGKPCWWCGAPMFRDASKNPDREPLHADHTLARSRGGTTADRLLHATCNRTRGNGDHDDQRPALIAHTAAQTHTDAANHDLGPLAMPWPQSWR